METKACPRCGETILVVAVRCKHCQANLDADPHARTVSGAGRDAADFEQRFLTFAYETSMPIDAPSVAYGLKVSIAEAQERLEELAAQDVLRREIDSEGIVHFALRGRKQVTTLAPLGISLLSPYSPPGPLAPPTEGTALAGLLLNALLLPGLGSLVGGKTSEGVLQLMLFVVGIPMCLVLIGFPMILTAWIWGLVTGIHMLNESKAALPPTG